MRNQTFTMGNNIPDYAPNIHIDMNTFSSVLFVHRTLKQLPKFMKEL